MANKVNISCSLSLLSTNRYRVTIDLAKVGISWNAYGIRCYAVVGGTKNLLGTFTIAESGSTVSPNSYTYDFNVSSDTTVYAKYECSHCSGTGSEEGWWGQSGSVVATYTNPNTAPPTPTISCLNYAAPGKYLLEKTLDVELGAVSDPQGDTVTYGIYAQYKNSSGNWVTAGDVNNCILYSTTSRKVSHNIEKYPRGTQFKIWGVAVDSNGAASSNTGTIDNIYRNQAPGAPTISCTNDQIDGKYVCENTITIMLSTVTDPENISVLYHIYGQYLSPGSSTWVSLGDGNNYIINSKSHTINIENFARGTQFKIWGAATDNFAAWTGSATIDNIYKNSLPNPIGTISPASSVISSSSLTISWEDKGDPNNQLLEYTIYISKDDGDYTLVSDRQPQLSYTHDISSDPKGTSYRFKISASDGMIEGAQKESPIYRKDFAPILINPINNSIVYQINPRILFSIIKKSGIYTCISYNGKTYNSRDNSSMFTSSNSQHMNEKAIVFKALNLNQGLNTITIYHSDGTLNSSSVSLNINVEDIDYDIITNYISKQSMDNIRQKCNALRASYSLEQFVFDNIERQSTIVKYNNDISNLRDNIDAIRNKINIYDTNKITQTWNNIAKGSIINNEDLKQIIDSLKNI